MQRSRGAWNAGPVSSSADREWLTLPDLVTLLGQSPGRIHRLVEDHQLLGSRADGVFRVPADFFRDGEPLSELRGTVLVLLDAGFSEDEALAWLLEPAEELDGTAPIDALRAGRKAEVRRVAQSLAL